jgi:hypothetical protein
MWPRPRSSAATRRARSSSGRASGSTRTEEELRSSKRGFANVARILAIVFAVVGVVLVVLGLIL